jgi:hypothetical protein
MFYIVAQEAVVGFRAYISRTITCSRLEQLEMLGGEVVAILRKEFASQRPVHVPAGPPTPG